ncbi:PTPA-CTERM sorting domain-containing protein [Leptolyngbya ohadii]|uniref:PTPA-CTERM sorting domain-containing protein n=1 Tax=Leptolyngbya ohadii TaxID=1962290 RepID=UPI0019D474EC|nr:PTPA-CTERM sorting domain-containing protein [Leptolyngbya ohadii]
MTTKMKMLSAFAAGATLSAACLLGASSAEAATIVLGFEGLQDLERVTNFYNGGLGSFGSGPGPNYGISFSSDALALIDADAGGGGDFGGEPSPSTVLFFLSNTAVMNVPAGFDTGFSFFYSSPFFSGTVNVYDGLNKTGNLLASLTLPFTPDNGAPDPNGIYSPFVPFGVSFSGIARSVDFGGVANFIAFDDITLGSETPGTQIPTPALLPGLVGMGIAAYRKRKGELAQEDSDA